jgi:hypothetical protein
MTPITTTHFCSLPFKGRAGEGMVFESPSRFSRDTIPAQTLPLKGRASKRAVMGGVL